MAASIFISYAHEDRPRAEQLAARFVSAGWSVWWDRQIVGGARFDKATEKAIAAAKIVVALWSRASVGSAWVRAEAAWALDKDKLLPVKIDDVDLPLQFFHVPTIYLAGLDIATDAPPLLRLLAEVDRRMLLGLSPTNKTIQLGLSPTNQNSLIEDAPRVAVAAQDIEASAVLLPPESISSRPSGPGRGMLPPKGFWSYTTSDEKNSRGKLSQVRALLAAELQQHIGRIPEVRIFQDVSAIPPGQDWEKQIRDALGSCSFMIPLVTPAFFQSEWCCREVTMFRAREASLGRNDLIYPIHWLDTDHTDPEFPDDCYDKETFYFLRTRQWIDFRRLRLGSLNNREAREKLAQISIALRDALRRP